MSASRGCRCSRHNTDSAGRFLKTLVRQPCSVTVVVVQEKKSPHHLVSSTNQMALVHPRLTVKKEAVPSVCFFLDLWVHVFVSFRGGDLLGSSIFGCVSVFTGDGRDRFWFSQDIEDRVSFKHAHSLTYTHTYTHICTRANSKQ